MAETLDHVCEQLEPVELFVRDQNAQMITNAPRGAPPPSDY
jgi:hypothetical protein